MPRFLTGDELGNIKSVHCTRDTQLDSAWKIDERLLHAPAARFEPDLGEVDVQKIGASAIQRLSALKISEHTVLAAARSDGALSAFSVDTGNAKVELLSEWRDSRFKPGHKFVGMNLASGGFYWCTSNGALGFAPMNADEEKLTFPTYQKATLPMPLRAWQLSADAASFAYGGDEVDLSVWNTERALQAKGGSIPGRTSEDTGSMESKKRKRGTDLLPGEVWRAKNLPNDPLNLRQPIHITALTHLSSMPSGISAGADVHLVTGTLAGDIRRYDTRAARKPVANWTGIGKNCSISVIQAGLSEHELFVADNGTNLSALDLRNGRTIYSYKKLQGAVTALSPSPGGFLGSTSRDRFFRLHSTFPPPEIAGRSQDERGEVLGSNFMKSVPTAVVSDISWDAVEPSAGENDGSQDDADEVDGDDEDVWAGMEDVGESSGDEGKDKKSKRRP
ncbi:hypothetical protein M0805_006823 [Coniferiporia weirii]|nr:hypothetical protein M0805_006823 [Coniferiporia weirii]